MCWLWTWPLLGLAMLVSSEESTLVSCNGTLLPVEPPLWGRMVDDEAHFVCSTGYKLVGQRILTCYNENWNHKVPICEELPPTMIKMKCPYDHRVWTIENLNNITSWISDNANEVIVIDRDFIEETPESQRLAAEMLARFNDPFFRFYGKLATIEKGVSLSRIIHRFQESLEFRQLVRQMQEDFEEFPINEIDEEENVLLIQYGLHYGKVLQDILLPYSKLITIKDDLEEEQQQQHQQLHQQQEHEQQSAKLNLPKVPLDVMLDSSSFETDPKTLPEFIDEAKFPTQGILADEIPEISDEYSLKRENETINKFLINMKKRPVRERGDQAKLLPSKSADEDYFHRKVNQVLEGDKGVIQQRAHRNSYLMYLKAIVTHILKYNVEKSKWPESLRPYDLEELVVVLNIPDITPIQPECSAPGSLGYDLVSNGRASLDPTNKVVRITCYPGYSLRGSNQLYCNAGRWTPRTGEMPMCMNMQTPQCRGPRPQVANARIVATEPHFLTMECMPGYTMTGSNIFTCQDNQWVPSLRVMPVCSEIRQNPCGTPPAAAYATAAKPHFMSDRKRFVVRYFCQSGYSMKGDDYLFCKDGEWEAFKFRCEIGGNDEIPENQEMPQVPKKCGKLVVKFGSSKYYEDGSSSVRVTCLPGYQMKGPEVVRCENGVYEEPLPRCIDRVLECGTPPSPVNGYFETITETAVRYSCKPGFTLQGKDRANCYQGEWFPAAPLCVERLGCDNIEQLTNTNLFGFIYSNGRWLQCADNNEAIGSNHQFCQGNRWGPEPRCPSSSVVQRTSVLHPEVFDCPLPEVPPGSGLTIFSRGERIFYRCKSRDLIIIGSRSNECVNGRWRNEIPRCESRQVSPPLPTSAPQYRCLARPIRGGEAYVYSEGRVIHYQCKSQYFIKGQTTTQCERSQWNVQAPACLAVGEVLAQEDGEVFYDAMMCPAPVYDSRTMTISISDRGFKVILQCADGTLGMKRCSNGRWTGKDPVCRTSGQGVCEPQEIVNGQFFQYRSNEGIVQCNRNFVIENTTSSRSREVYCNSETGRWNFGLTPPRCVEGPPGSVDTRPIDDDANNDPGTSGNTRQVEDCGAPKPTSEFTFYIGNDGRSIALGCKQARMRRSAGNINCIQGIWKYSFGRPCNSSDCGLADVKIENGMKILYDSNEYVFQCHPYHELVGQPVAHCPNYQPEGNFNPELVQTFGPNFKPPQCVRQILDPRPITEENFVESDFAQPCKWLSEFGTLGPQQYYISDGGQSVTQKVGLKDTTSICQANGLWLIKAIQTRDKCELPTEPEHGTYFLYQNSTGISIYFQCIDNYMLKGSRVSRCSNSRVQVPDCVSFFGASPGIYPKIKNPTPLTPNRCPQPPEWYSNAEISIHGSGDMYVINCNPGFVIETTRQTSAEVRCRQNSWEPRFLPRCLRDGERVPPTPNREPRRDLFGRPLPQQLTGTKAEQEDQRLRQQFREHTMQLVNFAKTRNRELRRAGIPAAELPTSQQLPLDPSLTDDEREALYRKNEMFYREIEALLANIREERIRMRRQNTPITLPSDNQTHIPAILDYLEGPIRQYNLSQPDIEVMVLLSKSDRVKFLDDKKKQQEKAKSDPEQSRNFIRKALAKKLKSHKLKNTTIEKTKSKSSEEHDDVVSLSTENSTTTVSSTTQEEISTPSEQNSIPLEGFSRIEDKPTTSSNETTTEEVPPLDSTPGAAQETTSEASPESTTSIQESSSTRKGFDDSCAYTDVKAPEIDHGFVVSYEVIDEPDGKILEANYRCEEDYIFEFEYTAKVRCRNGNWVGELPVCVPEDE